MKRLISKFTAALCLTAVLLTSLPVSAQAAGYTRQYYDRIWRGATDQKTEQIDTQTKKTSVIYKSVCMPVKVGKITPKSSCIKVEFLKDTSLVKYQYQISTKPSFAKKYIVKSGRIRSSIYDGTLKIHEVSSSLYENGIKGGTERGYYIYNSFLEGSTVNEEASSMLYGQNLVCTNDATDYGFTNIWGVYGKNYRCNPMGCLNYCAKKKCNGKDMRTLKIKVPVEKGQRYYIRYRAQYPDASGKYIYSKWSDTKAFKR